MVARPEINEETRSLPARAATMVLWAPLTQGPWSAVVTMPRKSCLKVVKLIQPLDQRMHTILTLLLVILVHCNNTI